MKKQYLVMGMGKFGFYLGKELKKMGHEVAAIDIDSKVTDNMGDEFDYVMTADCMDEGVLNSVDAQSYDVVVVAIGEVQASVMVTLRLKEMGVSRVVSRANSEIHAKLLTKIGADRVVFPERDTGIRIAHGLVSSNILEAIELSQNHSMIELGVTEEWAGKTLMQVDFRKKWGVNIIGIRHSDGSLNISPRADDILKKEYVLIIIGEDASINKLEKAFH